jgi:hypothetical protein
VGAVLEESKGEMHFSILPDAESSCEYGVRMGL